VIAQKKNESEDGGRGHEEREAARIDVSGKGRTEKNVLKGSRLPCPDSKTRHRGVVSGGKAATSTSLKEGREGN